MNTYLRESGTVNLMKNLNIEKVYKQILLNGSISRARVSQITDMNKVTVSKCTDFLLKKNIIKENGSIESVGGRPPIMLSLREDFGLFVGIEINHISNLIMIADITGKPLVLEALPDFKDDPAIFFKQLPHILDDYLQKLPETKQGFVGLGIAFPTNYNKKSDTIENIYSMQKWKGVHVRRELEKALPGMKIFVMVSSEAGARGEIHFGVSNPFEHLAYLYGTWGITMAMYSAGSMYTGSSGFAGRFGHTIVETGGRSCVCGNKGCLEAYASVRPIVNKFYSDDSFINEHISDLLVRLESNDPDVNREIDVLTHYLSVGLVNIINMYNPDRICIGGYLAKLLSKDVIDKINERVKKMTLPHFSKGLVIVTSRLKEFGPVYGCVATLRDNLIDIVTEDDKVS